MNCSHPIVREGKCLRCHSKGLNNPVEVAKECFK